MSVLARAPRRLGAFLAQLSPTVENNRMMMRGLLSPALPAFSSFSPRFPTFLAARFSSSASSAFAPSKPTSPSIIPPQHPKDAGRLTVCLDMDETLIHTECENLSSRSSSLPGHISEAPTGTRHFHPKLKFHYDIYFDIAEANYPTVRYFVSIRPGLKEFLSRLQEVFEPILFTSALPVYAGPILDYIEKFYFPAKEKYGDRPWGFRARLFRSSTVKYRTVDYVKDIRRFHRSLRRIVLVDNSDLALLAVPENGIPIEDYMGKNGQEKSDKELERVMKMLVDMEEILIKGDKEEKGQKATVAAEHPASLSLPQVVSSYPVSSSDWEFGPDIRPYLKERVNFRASRKIPWAAHQD